MSFSVTQKIAGRLKYASIGVELRDEYHEVSVTYTLQSINMNAEDGSVVAIFKSSIDGCLYDGIVEFRFTKDTNSDIIEEAEVKFKNSII